MVSRANDIDTAIVVSARDQASEDIGKVGGSVEGLDLSVASLSKNLIGLGLAAFAASFGVGMIGGSVQEFAVSASQTATAANMLGPAVAAAYEAMKEELRIAGIEVGATSRQMKEAFFIMSENAGGLIPTVDDVALAFKLARVEEVSAATAAAVLGQAMQGNVEPLNQMRDASGRLKVSLESTREEVEANFTVWDDLFRLFVRQGLDNLGALLSGAFEFDEGSVSDRIWTFFTETLPNMIGGIDFSDIFPDLGRIFVDSIWDPIRTFFTETLPNFLSDPSEFLPDWLLNLDPRNLFSSGTSGGESSGQQVNYITINGDSSTPEGRADLVRQLSRELQNNNRRGVNVSVSA
jgi:hypothetical protein